MQKEIGECIFDTDNSIMASYSMFGSLVTADWRAYEENFQIWRLLKENTSYSCMHVPRGAYKMKRESKSYTGIYWYWLVGKGNRGDNNE